MKYARHNALRVWTTPYVYAKNSAGFRFDEKNFHYVDGFLVTCGVMLLGV
jgi:hypothetical protein